MFIKNLQSTRNGRNIKQVLFFSALTESWSFNFFFSVYQPFLYPVDRYSKMWTKTPSSLNSELHRTAREEKLSAKTIRKTKWSVVHIVFFLFPSYFQLLYFTVVRVIAFSSFLLTPTQCLFSKAVLWNEMVSVVRILYKIYSKEGSEIFSYWIFYSSFMVHIYASFPPVLLLIRFSAMWQKICNLEVWLSKWGVSPY